MFQQAKQNRIFQDIITQIQEAILSGQLKAGDKLPAERKLKDMFNTSRGTLREALRVLEQKGLISIKTGTSGGAIVKEVTSNQISESLDLLIRSQKVSLRHLADFREGVEGTVTSLAAKYADKNAILKLNSILYKAEENIKKERPDWNEFINIDNEFHMTLAEIAQNPIFISVLKTIHDNINRYYNQFLSREDKIIIEGCNDMRRIIQAVENGREKEAGELARKHVERFNEFMEKKYNNVENGKLEHNY